MKYPWICKHLCGYYLTCNILLSEPCYCEIKRERKHLSEMSAIPAAIFKSYDEEQKKLQQKACRKILQTCSKNDVWNMKRFQAINGYFAEL